MKLPNKEFKRYLELSKKKDLTPEEKSELEALIAKKKEGSNDISWYKNYPELLKDVSNIAFNYIGGKAISLHGRGESIAKYYIPAVTVLHYQRTIGNARYSSDAFNAQMRQLWLDMHRKYRGIGTYQSSDVGMCNLAILELFATIAKFERIYGVLNTYKIANRNVPYALLEALHIDYADFTTKLADFRYGLNQRISKAKALCLPKGIAAFESALTLNLFIFKDSDNVRSTMYLWDSDSFGYYDATTLPTGGCVRFRNFSAYMTGTTPEGNLGFKVSDVFGILDDQLDKLLNDDDITKICSDIIAAYSDNNLFTVNYVEENMRIEPMYDYERHVQLHNTTIVGRCFTKCYADDGEAFPDANAYANVINMTPVVIFQVNNVMKCNLTTCDLTNATATPTTDDTGARVMASAASDSCAKRDDVLLDTWVDKPGEVEVMCGTRFTTLCGPEIGVGGNMYYQNLEAFGSEVVKSITIHQFNDLDNQLKEITINKSYVAADGAYRVDVVDAITKVDWHPLIYVEDIDDNLLRIVGDLDNSAIVTTLNLSRIHDVALYSAYKIPMVSYIS